MLKINRLRVQRQAFVLQADRLEAPDGGRVTVIGPSGSGKSTLLRVMAGLDVVGKVEFEASWREQPLAGLRPDHRPFGWLSQDLGLWPHMTAVEHVAFARTRGRSRQTAAADLTLLARVGLAHRDSALPANMSGGERQRLAFARVMAQRPAWALLDEPFSSLDVVTADRMAEEFSMLAAEHGIGIIQVTHQIVRPSAADQVWVVEQGGVVQAASWQDLIRKPHSSWIEQFLSLRQEFPHAN